MHSVNIVKCGCSTLQIDIEINGEPVELHMKLGDNGEAFFVQEMELHNVGFMMRTNLHSAFHWVVCFWHHSCFYFGPSPT